MGRGSRFLAAVAIALLLTPLLTPLSPSLAAWSPQHAHVYAGGVPVPHSHPWEQRQSTPASPQPVFHLCSVHPDGIVPAVAVPVNASASSADEAAPAGDGVVFLFDHDLFGSVLLPPASPSASCGGVAVAMAPVPAGRPTSVTSSPRVPPPKPA